MFDEEYAELEKKVGPDLSKNPDLYTRFFRPEGCAWRNILNTSVNIGEKINDVFKKITVANSPKLDGILDRIDFNDKDSPPACRLYDVRAFTSPGNQFTVPLEL